jgi:hypothetical protein
MKIRSVKTERKIKKSPSYDLVYEWEDVFHRELDIPLAYFRGYDQYVDKIIRIINSNPRRLSNHYSLMYCLSARVKDSRYNRPDILPAIIDFNLAKEELINFYKAYSKNRFILISGLEVFDFLKQNKCPKVIYHFPLSIADKYKITPTVKFEKVYDLVLMGRRNPVLDQYLKKYLEKNNDFTYVYRNRDGNVFDYYTSKGEFLGNIDNREAYIDLMRKSKIGFYSTPIDVEESVTNGLNQVTPRFLELIACGCHIIARYKKNADTDFYQLDRFCSPINTYNDFEKEMDKARHNEVDMKMYSEYLENHYTSKRVELFKTILEQEHIAWKK